MNVRNVLESHRKLKGKIKITLKEIEEQRQLAEKVISNASEAERIHIVNAVVAADERLNEEYNRYVALQEKISRIIDTLDNESELIALKCVYILHYNNERTAAEMGYSARHVSRFLKSGLEKLQEKYNDVDINDIEQED